MELLLKIGSLLSLMAITTQDFKERKVSLYLFMLALIFVTSLYYNNENLVVFLKNIGFNLFVIVCVLSVLFVYAWFKLKQPLFEVFGFGDVLFFIILACGFPISTFIVFFVSSLIFALAVFIALKFKLKNKTVPLAGLQALFLILLFGVNWMFNLVNLYQ